MNPITKLIATVVVGLIAATMAVVIGMVVLGVGHAHAAGMTGPHASYAVSYVARGHGGHRS
jgi:hypothetical protein